MQTSDNSYAVTENKQEEGTYTLGAVATEQITSDDSSDSSSSQTSRLTVISSESMINSQITDTYTTLENLDLFMNAVTANFDKTKKYSNQSEEPGGKATIRCSHAGNHQHPDNLRNSACNPDLWIHALVEEKKSVN